MNASIPSIDHSQLSQEPKNINMHVVEDVNQKWDQLMGGCQDQKMEQDSDIRSHPSMAEGEKYKNIHYFHEDQDPSSEEKADKNDWDTEKSNLEKIEEKSEGESPQKKKAPKVIAHVSPQKVEVIQISFAEKPKEMPTVSPFAKDLIAQMEAAMKAKDSETFCDLIFEVECNDLTEQIDLPWYEQMASKLQEE